MSTDGAKPGFGRISNELVESGAWALFDPYMRSVYAVLLTICKRPMTHEDKHGRWVAREGFPSVARLAELSGVRRSSISATTDALAWLGIILKTPWRIKDSPRTKYIILPSEHPIFHSVSARCRKRKSHYRSDRWGLRQHRKGAPTIKTTVPTVVTPTVPTVGTQDGGTQSLPQGTPHVSQRQCKETDLQKIKEPKEKAKDAGAESRVSFSSSSLSRKDQKPKNTATERTDGRPDLQAQQRAKDIWAFFEEEAKNPNSAFRSWE